MLSQGARAARELPAGRDWAYGEVVKGEGRKPLSNRASFYLTERDLSSVVKKPTCELAVEGKEELRSVWLMSSFVVLFLLFQHFCGY